MKKAICALSLIFACMLCSCGTAPTTSVTSTAPSAPSLSGVQPRAAASTQTPLSAPDSSASGLGSEPDLLDEVFPTPEDSISVQDEGVTVYDCGLIEIALPNKYLPQLEVEVVQSERQSYRLHVRVYEKLSLEQSKADLGLDCSSGFLFGFASVDKDFYGEFWDMSPAGSTIFAEDDAHYYVYVEPTDVQLYRSSGETEEDEKVWNELSSIGTQVREDVIVRCGLVPCSAPQWTTDTYIPEYPDSAGPDFTIETLDCPICGGIGFCTDCIGGQCNDCFGRGRNICVSCVGLGHCNYCGGDGYIYQGVGISFGKYNCSYCRGSGDCYSCSNTGYISCSTCGGTGNCRTCFGLGRCAFCAGTGRVFA